MVIQNLRCSLLSEPRGIDFLAPDLSWELAEAQPGHQFQRAYRIVVATHAAAAAAGQGNLWDTGRVEDDRTTFIRYSGLPLRSRMECYWRVTAWDESGTEFTSEVGSWTMGLLERKDWAGHWIGLDAAPEFPPDPLPGARWIWDHDTRPGRVTFEKTFRLDEAAPGLLWGLADDEAEVEINGHPIGQLARAQGNFNLFPLPVAIEVAGLRTGENVVRVRARKRHDRDAHAGIILRLRVGGKEWREVQRTEGVEFTGTVHRRQEGGVEIVTDATWSGRREHQPASTRELGSFGVPPWHLQSPQEYPNLPARYLRREFFAPRPIKRATLYFSGLGLSEAWLNGRRIGREALSPHATDYHARVYYRTFDVTGHLREGANAIGCILGNGRFFAPRFRVPFPMENYGCPKMRLQLELTYDDGSTDRIVSDTSWRLTTDGAIGWNNEFDGEEYDARKDDDAWSLPGYDDHSWTPPQRVAAPMGRLQAQVSDPIHISETLAVKASWATKYGTTIHDFGVNLVGWCRGKITGAAGQRLTLHHAETLESRDALAVENLRSALATDTVTLREGATEFEPKFTCHGFRYMELRGAPAAAEFVACVVHDEVPATGSFTCSNEIVNQIVTAAARGIRGNYRSMPMDCPQRDERMGWLGDRGGGAPGEMFLFDVSKVYRKWMDDIRDAQGVNGCVPDIAPPFWRMYSDNVTWPSCLVFIPHWLQRHYGDAGVVEKNFGAMERWLEHMSDYLEDGLLDRDVYGDWCVPPEARHLIHSERADRKTSPLILASTYLAQNLALATAFAERLGRPEIAQRWQVRRREIAAALNARFLDEASGVYDNGSQTAALLPLAFGLTPEPQRRRVFDYLVSRLTESGHPTLGTGLVGGQWLMRTLTAYGRADLALALATREEYPGWGYMVRQGATTIWELWNGDTADPLMNSGNHVMLLGDLVTWLFEDVAGIQPRRPGFAEITLRPHFVFDAVTCEHRSIRGPIGSRWETAGGKVEWTVTLPPNVQTHVELPASVAKTLRVNGAAPALAPLTLPQSPFPWVQTPLPPGSHVITCDRPEELGVTTR